MILYTHSIVMSAISITSRLISFVDLFHQQTIVLFSPANLGHMSISTIASKD